MSNEEPGADPGVNPDTEGDRAIPEDQLRKAVLQMADALGGLLDEEPDIDIDSLAGYLVGTMPSRSADKKIYMLSLTLAAALKMLRAAYTHTAPGTVQDLNTSPAPADPNEVCPCGCGTTREQAIRKIMAETSVSRSRAESVFNHARSISKIIRGDQQ